MLRHLLLSLSRQPHLRRFFETSPAAHSLTTRFIAGQTLADGIAVSRQLAARGISTALDHLGENVATEAEAAAARRETLDALDAIGASVNPAPSPATVAIKLTQFGLDLATNSASATSTPSSPAPAPSAPASKSIWSPPPTPAAPSPSSNRCTPHTAASVPFCRPICTVPKRMWPN
jgi:hypothetical protein